MIKSTISFQLKVLEQLVISHDIHLKYKFFFQKVYKILVFRRVD